MRIWMCAVFAGNSIQQAGDWSGDWGPCVQTTRQLSISKWNSSTAALSWLRPSTTWKRQTQNTPSNAVSFWGRKEHNRMWSVLTSLNRTILHNSKFMRWFFRFIRFIRFVLCALCTFHFDVRSTALCPVLYFLRSLRLCLCLFHNVLMWLGFSAFCAILLCESWNVCARSGTGTGNRRPDIYCCQTKRFVPLLIKAKIHQSTNPTNIAHGYFGMASAFSQNFVFFFHLLTSSTLLLDRSRVGLLIFAIVCGTAIFVACISGSLIVFRTISTSALCAQRVCGRREYIYLFFFYLLFSVFLSFLFVFIERKLLPYK